MGRAGADAGPSLGDVIMPTLATFTAWIRTLADVYEENKEMLTQLDAAIGDADHGISMARGFAAARDALEKTPPADIPTLFKTVSMALIKNVGGASGPLYGTLFMKAGPLLAADPVTVETLAAAFAAGVEGIGKMGKSVAGEKTMLDAWIPAVAALRESAGADAGAALAAAAEAAKRGMEATIPMRATKGRASYLGERSVGHQDPGATSTWLMLSTLAGQA